MFSIESPRLRANDDEERRATWLESLYDLVFAVTVFGLVDTLADDATFAQFGRFLFLFLVLWWAWIGPTIYLTRFDTNDFVHQAITFGQMLAAAALTTQIPHVFAGNATIFVLSFLFVRYSLLFMYGRAHWYLPDARPITRTYLLGFSVGTALWTLSLLIAPPLQYGLWASGLAIEVMVPWLGRGVLRQAPVDTSHLPERFAQFNLIVLGQNVYEIITSLGNVAWNSTTVGAAALLLAITVATAGRYFIYTDCRSDTIKRTLGPGQAQIYAHLPFVVGVAMLSAAAPRVIAEAGNVLFSLPTLWLLVGGAGLCSLAGIFLYLSTTETPQRKPIVQRSILLVVTLLVGVVGLWLPPFVVLGMVLGTMLVGLSLVSRLRK